MVRMVVLWLKVESPVMKSCAMCDQGLWGMGRGCKRPWGGLVGYLSLSTDRAGGDKVLNVLPHLRPPELALNEGYLVACARVTGELGGMTPLNYLWACAGRYVQSSIWRIIGCGFGLLGLLDCPFNVHFNGVDKNLGSENGNGIGFLSGALKVAGEGVRFNVLGSGLICEVEVEPGEKQSPPGLMRIKSLSLFL